jgi:ComF family protein
MLIDQEKIICLFCRFDLPLIDHENYDSNEITRIFKGRIPIEKGASLLHYTETGKVKKLIHELKYKNRQDIGVFIGNWLGTKLKGSCFSHDIDCIIPVPLHQKKLKQRGYNQLTQFGKSLSAILEIEYCDHILQRVSFTKTQTFKKRLDRFRNTDSKFIVKNTKSLTGKHVLLIDDVVTTGATLESCCQELLKAKNVRISIVTMAITV